MSAIHLIDAALLVAAVFGLGFALGQLWPHRPEARPVLRLLALLLFLAALSALVSIQTFLSPGWVLVARVALFFGFIGASIHGIRLVRRTSVTARQSAAP